MLIRLFAQRWGLGPGIPNVVQRQRRVMQQHSWPSVAHDNLHLFLHLGAIAMNEALAASALLFLEGTLVQPHVSVG